MRYVDLFSLSSSFPPSLPPSLPSLLSLPPSLPPSLLSLPPSLPLFLPPSLPVFRCVQCFQPFKEGEFYEVHSHMCSECSSTVIIYLQCLCPCSMREGNTVPMTSTRSLLRAAVAVVSMALSLFSSLNLPLSYHFRAPSLTLSLSPHPR